MTSAIEQPSLVTAQPFARDRNAITYCICMFSALSASESVSPLWWELSGLSAC